MRQGLKGVRDGALAGLGAALDRPSSGDDRANGASAGAPPARVSGPNDGPQKGTRRRVRSVARAAAYVAVFGSAVVGVYYATRGKSAPTTMAPAHNHGGAVPGTNAAHPIALTPSDAQRIGVTYAAATLGPLAKEVRTVGQVTFDETKLHTIAPKIDGWVDQLVVNATGQYVTAGQALLTIYSPMLVTAQEELLLAKRGVCRVQHGDR